jgi:hypothetical protein
MHCSLGGLSWGVKHVQVYFGGDNGRSLVVRRTFAPHAGQELSIAGRLRKRKRREAAELRKR